MWGMLKDTAKEADTVANAKGRKLHPSKASHSIPSLTYNYHKIDLMFAKAAAKKSSECRV